MPDGHSKATIISMAIVASMAATLSHEAVGHGLTAWLRGDVPVELTSNHLSTLHPDRWVEAAGTLVNLFAGAVFFLASRSFGWSANTRYSLWLLAALNLLPGAGYFLFSGVFGFGDWQGVIDGLPHQAALRVLMVLGGAVLYVTVLRFLAVAVKPFCPKRSTYNVVGRLPYVAAGLFSCAAGMLDPLGWKLLLLSTAPAAFGGSSGLLWADSLFPAGSAEALLFVRRQPAWWCVAGVVGVAFVVIFGKGIQFGH